MKKIISLILSLILIFSAQIACAENTELMLNGGFESGTTGWKPYGSWGDYAFVTTGGCEGVNCLKITNSKSSVQPYASVSVSGLTEGKVYTLTSQIKRISLGSGSLAGFKLEYYNSSNTCIKEEVKTFPETGNLWQKAQYTFTVPDDCTAVTVAARLFGTGVVYFDDLSLIFNMDVKTELVSNGTFESGTTPWSTYGGKWGVYAFVINEGENGGKCLKIVNSDSAINPWAGQGIGNITPGAVYTVSAKIKTISLSSGVGFKLEFNDSNNKQISFTSKSFGATNRVWTTVSFNFTAPEGCTKMNLLPRLFGTGEVYFDDVSLMKSDAYELPYFYIVPETAFYYTENKTGYVRFRVNDNIYTIPDNSTITLQIKDGSTIKKSYTYAAADYVNMSFDTSWLSVEGREYTLYATLRSSGGGEIYSAYDTVYKYARPTRLDENGVFHNKDNDPVYPCIGYHCSSAYYNRLPEMGINVVQLYVGSNNTAGLLKALDAAQQNGLYILINLYTNMLPAGHPDNIENTRKYVSAAMNHPALFGYMIMDEPMINASDKEEMYRYLKDSYKAIRDIDSAHPVYSVECVEGGFEKTSNCVDIFAIDMYPSTLSAMPDRIYRTTKAAIEAVNGKKPVYHILQAYNLSGNYEPSSNDMRHMAYQAFFAGASNIGYYPVCDSDSILWENELYNGVAGFAALEQENAIKAFVTGENEVLDRQINEDGICGITYISNEEVYAVAINKSTVSKTVTLNAGIEGEVIAVNGGSISQASLSSGKLSLTLRGLQALCYKISPSPNAEAWFLKGDTRLYKYESGDVAMCTVGTGTSGYSLFGLYEKIGDTEKLIDVYRSGDIISLEDNKRYYIKGFLWNSGFAPKTDKIILKQQEH